MSSESPEGDDALERLAAGIAHDLNNLLTAILGRLDLLALDLPDESPYLQDVGEVREDARAAARVVARFLELTGQAPTRPQETELSELLDRLEERVVERRHTDVRVLAVLEAGAGPIWVDADQIRRVVEALVDNALEAIPGEGILLVRAFRIELSARPEHGATDLAPGPYVCLEVVDSGVGMDAATLARVFEPYFSTKPAGAGRGLQLAAARQIARQNGGALTLESEPGEGTTALLLLPAYRWQETGEGGDGP